MNSAFRVALRQFSTAQTARAGGNVPAGKNRFCNVFKVGLYCVEGEVNHRLLFRISADKAEAEDVVCGQRPESSPERRHGRRYSLQHLSGPHRHRRLPLGGHRLHPRLPQEINNFRALVMLSNMLRLYSDL